MLILKQPEVVNGEVIQGYGIDADSFNVILYKLMIVNSPDSSSNGQITRSAMSYCSTVKQCLERIYQLEVGLHGIESLEALNARVTSTIDTCVASLGEFNRVRGKIK